MGIITKGDCQGTVTPNPSQGFPSADFVNKSTESLWNFMWFELCLFLMLNNILIISLAPSLFPPIFFFFNKANLAIRFHAASAIDIICITKKRSGLSLQVKTTQTEFGNILFVSVKWLKYMTESCLKIKVTVTEEERAITSWTVISGVFLLFALRVKWDLSPPPYTVMLITWFFFSQMLFPFSVKNTVLPLVMYWR